MTIHRLDEVLDAPKPAITGLPARRGTRIDHGCKCRWLLARTDPSTWRRVAANPACRLHGGSSDENRVTG